MEHILNKLNSIRHSDIFQIIITLLLSTVLIYLGITFLNNTYGPTELDIFKFMPDLLDFPDLMQFFYNHFFVRTHFFANSFLILAFILLIYSITGRLRISIGITSIALFILGLVNYILISIRATPFTPADFASISLASQMSSNFNFAFGWQVVVAIVFLLVLCFFLFKKEKLIVPEKKRIYLRIVSIVIFTTIAILFFNTNVFSIKIEWDTLSSYKENGFLISFLTTFKSMYVSEPAGYSVENIKNSMNELDAETIAVENDEKPNVIAIMNETLADLGQIYDLDLSEDNMPFIHNLTDNTIKGRVHSSSLGCRTANCEFEFLTGDTARFLPDSMVAYQNYIKSPTKSLVSTLLDKNYSCSVFHPYYDSGYSRNIAYPLLGFENFEDISTLKELNFIRFGNYADDLSTYKNIISLYENKKEDEKIFNFTVTIQNHSPYHSDEFENNVYLKNFDKDTYSNINEYLSLIKLSDSAFEYLVNYFSNVDEKTIILMFGDHQPGFVNTTPEVFGIQEGSFDEKQYIGSFDEKQYITPFILWANYDIDEKDIGDISMNYLSTILLDVADLPKSDYFNFLSKLYEKYPVITDNIVIDRDGNVLDSSEIENNEDLKLYEYIQYNHLFDDENKLEEIF